MVQIGTISPKPQMNGSPEDPPTCHDVTDKPSRHIVRLLFGVASDSICQTQQNHQRILRWQCCHNVVQLGWMGNGIGHHVVHLNLEMEDFGRSHVIHMS